MESVCATLSTIKTGRVCVCEHSMRVCCPFIVSGVDTTQRQCHRVKSDVFIILKTFLLIWPRVMGIDSDDDDVLYSNTADFRKFTSKLGQVGAFWRYLAFTFQVQSL